MHTFAVMCGSTSVGANIIRLLPLSGSFSPRLRQDFALTGAKVRPNWGENEGVIFLIYHVYNSVFAREYPAEIPFTLHSFIIRSYKSNT